MSTRYPRYLAAAAAAAAAACLLAACGSSHPRRSSASAISPARTSSPAPRGAVPAPTAGLLPASPGLTDRLVLDQTHVTAGTPIKGALVVVNGGPAINLTHGCRPQYAVVLTNHRFPPGVAFPTYCSVAPFIIRPGETRLTVSVLTTYQSCTRAAGQATKARPACRHSRQIMPPLPAGRYAAVLVGSGLPLPAAAPVPVSLRTPAG